MAQPEELDLELWSAGAQPEELDLELWSAGAQPEERYLAEPIEGRCEVGDVDHDFDISDRTTWNVRDGVRVEVPIEEAIILSSRTRRTELFGERIHRPVIDIDVPVRLVPSTTPGHHHLYIDKDMSWGIYADLLKALAKAGVVEEGYVLAALEREATFVRLPWVKKKESAR